MRLGVLYTGGTIGSVLTPLRPLSTEEFSAAFKTYIEPVLISQYSDLVVGYIPFGTGTLDSTNLQPSDWCKMANDLLPCYDTYDAFLVLHGTDTMAFTASALSFLFTAIQANGFPNAVLSKPIIVTGSQIPLFYQATTSDPLQLRFDTDAFQNVCGAVAAAHTGVPEVGLFFENKLLRGNRTLKTNASEFDAFTSPNYPALGLAGIEFELDNDTVLPLPATPMVSLDNPAARAALQAQLAHITAQISNAKAMQFPAFPAAYTTGANATSRLADLLSAAIGTKAAGNLLDGIVLESYGEGNFPSGDPADPTSGAIYGVLKAAQDAGVVVMDNTQVLGGTVNSNAYASGSWLATVGSVGAFDMTPIASYCKLLFLQSVRDLYELSLDDMKRLMQTNLTGEIMDTNRLDSRNQLYLAAGESISALDGSATLTNDPTTGPTLTDSEGKTLWSALDQSGPTLPGRLYMQPNGELAWKIHPIKELRA